MNELIASNRLPRPERARGIRAPRVLVLGYGNPGRQDDGLGPAAAAEIGKLDWPGVTACDNYQLVIEDAVEIAEHDVVWFVDAARSGAEPYEVRPLVARARHRLHQPPGQAGGTPRHSQPVLRQVAGKPI